MDADQNRGEPYRLLFVCTGNTCRSPLAAAITRRALAARGWENVSVASAGLGAFDGAPASDGSLSAAARHDLDLSDHRSARVTRAMLEEADLILAMSPTHLFHLNDLGAGEKSVLLTAFAAAEDPAGIPPSVADPIGGSDEEYEETYRLLELLVERALLRLEPIVAP